MKPNNVAIRIKGVSPMLQNRKNFMLDCMDNPELNKQRGESYEDHDQRIWSKKAHYNDDGNVMIPGEWIKGLLKASQRRGKFPIQPPGARSKNDNMLPYFISGVLIEDSEITNNKKPIKEKDLLPYRCMVSPQRGSSVPRTRPMISDWESTIKFVIIDEAISEDCLVTVMTWIGTYFGMGDFRPQQGGNFGRFMLI